MNTWKTTLEILETLLVEHQQLRFTTYYCLCRTANLSPLETLPAHCRHDFVVDGHSVVCFCEQFCLSIMSNKCSTSTSFSGHKCESVCIVVEVLCCYLEEVQETLRPAPRWTSSWYSRQGWCQYGMRRTGCSKCAGSHHLLHWMYTAKKGKVKQPTWEWFFKKEIVPIILIVVHCYTYFIVFCITIWNFSAVVYAYVGMYYHNLGLFSYFMWKNDSRLGLYILSHSCVCVLKKCY
jgi:hypothetical protein